jgi:hypothetical protein
MAVSTGCVNDFRGGGFGLEAPLVVSPPSDMLYDKFQTILLVLCIGRPLSSTKTIKNSRAGKHNPHNPSKSFDSLTFTLNALSHIIFGLLVTKFRGHQEQGT